MVGDKVAGLPASEVEHLVAVWQLACHEARFPRCLGMSLVNEDDGLSLVQPGLHGSGQLVLAFLVSKVSTECHDLDKLGSLLQILDRRALEEDDFPTNGLGKQVLGTGTNQS